MRTLKTTTRQPRQKQDRIGPWNGTHGRGAMKAHRDHKRQQAEARNALTPPSRRAKYQPPDMSYAKGSSPKAKRRAKRKGKAK